MPALSPGSKGFVMKSTLASLVSLSFLALAACSHHDSPPAESAAGQEPRVVASIRTRASFDLGCPADQVQVMELEKGTFMRPATFGVTCGDKRATYLERMGTIIRQ